MMALPFAAVGFGAAAWLGAVLGRMFCLGQVPFDDGPSPVTVRAWTIAAAGSCVGIGLAFHGASPLQLGTIALVVVALAACTVSDFQIGIVPDLFTLVPLGALLLSSCLQGNFNPLYAALITALPFAVVAALSNGIGLGWGDVKLVALTGALLGARDALLALAIACIAAIFLSRVRGLRGNPVAFGPYLVGGIGAVLMFGSRL